MSAIAAIGEAISGPWIAKNVASRDRKFAEIMSSTQYQRGVIDLRAAGLNPILAASRGFQASAPVTKGTAQRPSGVGTKLMGLKLQERMVTAQEALMAAQAENATASAENTRAQIPIRLADQPGREAKGRAYTQFNRIFDWAKEGGWGDWLVEQNAKADRGAAHVQRYLEEIIRQSPSSAKDAARKNKTIQRMKQYLRWITAKVPKKKKLPFVQAPLRNPDYRRRAR